MLKTLKNKKMWLVTQPDHAEVAGFLAAHWGNDNFVRPGHFGHSEDPERLWSETVLAIAEHDNGWWEWEAIPEISEVDGLPLGLIDVLKNQHDGMNRWRLGIPRFSQDHPYVGLLISFHAYWLYAKGLETEGSPAFNHPLFWKDSSTQLKGEQLDNVRSFIAEIKKLQEELMTRLREDPALMAWANQENLYPNIRLLQLLDALSLSLCSALIASRVGETKGLGEDEFDLFEVPRRNWEDRLTIELKSVGERKILCKPYPFDTDPLQVFVPARIFDWPVKPATYFQWNSVPKQSVRFEFCSS